MSRPERDEELLSVQSIYCDDFNTFEAVDPTHFRFRSIPVVISIMLPLAYPDPCHLPEISVDSEGLGVSRMQMYQLQMKLEDIIQSKPDDLVLFDLTEETREFTEGLRDDVVLSLEQEDEDWYEDAWDAGEYDQRETDLAIAQSYMGSMTLQSIMEQLPKSVDLLHAENVLRRDLRERYQKMHRKIQHDVTYGIHDRRAKDTAWDKYGRQEIVFHGTLRRHVGSIVRSGFIVPGQKTLDGEIVEIRCGTTWGQGIYTSPDPDYSLCYTDYTEGGFKGRRRLLPGQKLIVCVIAMGRRAEFSEHTNGARRLNCTVKDGFHSHVSPNKKEYVVFNSAQVLPLFVLHLGDRSKKKATHDDAPILQSGGIPSIVAARGDVQVKRVLTDYARKHLPNGFGAASGHRFVVEEIAPVDDDEELWGDYQNDVIDDWDGEFQEERLRW